jgi:hypothetical protein
MLLWYTPAEKKIHESKHIFPSISVTGKREEADKSPMQFYRKAVLFLTIDLAEDLLDLLLAAIAVDVHLEDAGLWIWGWKHAHKQHAERSDRGASKLKKFHGMQRKQERTYICGRMSWVQRKQR